MAEPYHPVTANTPPGRRRIPSEHSGGVGSRHSGRGFSSRRRGAVSRGSSHPEITETYPSGYKNIFPAPSEIVERLDFTPHAKFDPAQIEYITKPRDARRLVKPILMSAPAAVFDAETAHKETGLPTTHTKDADLILTQFCPLVEGWQDKPVFVLRGNDCARELAPWFASPKHLKIGHNLGYDGWAVKEGLGLPFQGFFADTLLMYWSLDTEKGEDDSVRDLNLEKILLIVYGTTYPSMDKVWGKHKGKGNKKVFPSMWDVLENPLSPFYNKDEALGYAAKDVWECAWLFQDLRRILKHEGLWDLHLQVEFRLMQVLDEMEHRGLALDPRMLAEIQDECERKYARLRHRWRHQVRSPYANPSSSASKQRQHVFFTHGELVMKSGPYSKPGPHRFMDCGCAKPHYYDPNNRSHVTDAGYPSCDKDAIARLAREHCKAAELLEIIGSDEEVLKFAKGFRKGLTEHVSEGGHVFHTVHPSWWPMLRTTRVSASSNRYGTGRTLQNIPKDPDKDPYKIRRAFLSRPGYALICADYSQLELRILAWLTQDPVLLETFRLGADPHSMMAVAVFGLDCPWEEVKERYPEKRDAIKPVNYGIPYGLSEYGLSLQQKITIDEAKRLMDMWYDACPLAKDYIHSCHNFARQHGFIQTLYGRRRYLPALHNARLRGAFGPPPEEARGRFKHEYNVASNHPIQGMAGMLMRMGQVTLAYDPLYKEMDMHQDAQVHDELLVEVPVSLAEEGMALVKTHMEAAKHNVLTLAFGPDYPRLEPEFPAEPGVGFCWAEAK